MRLPELDSGQITEKRKISGEKGTVNAENLKMAAESRQL